MESAERLSWSWQPFLAPPPCISADAEDGGRQAPKEAPSKSLTGQQSKAPAKVASQLWAKGTPHLLLLLTVL